MWRFCACMSPFNEVTSLSNSSICDSRDFLSISKSAISFKRIAWYSSLLSASTFAN